MQPGGLTGQKSRPGISEFICTQIPRPGSSSLALGCGESKAFISAALTLRNVAPWHRTARGRRNRGRRNRARRNRARRHSGLHQTLEPTANPVRYAGASRRQRTSKCDVRCDGQVLSGTGQRQLRSPTMLGANPETAVKTRICHTTAHALSMDVRPCSRSD